jgi:hypothetical protein
MKFVVTVDVEGGSEPDRYESVDVLDSILQESNLPYTLFVTPDVIQNRPEIVRTWVDAEHAVGLHIHPARLEGGESDYLTDYGRAEIENFVTQGCEVFEKVLGTTPRGFRAGRWEYSERLHEVLGKLEFDYDASLRPNRPCEPFIRNGVTEYPHSVYSTLLIRGLLKPWDALTDAMNSIAFSPDAWFSRSFPARVSFRAATKRVLQSGRLYLMIAYHDYDILKEPLRSRIQSYQSNVTEQLHQVSIQKL